MSVACSFSTAPTHTRTAFARTGTHSPASCFLICTCLACSFSMQCHQVRSASCAHGRRCLRCGSRINHVSPCSDSLTVPCLFFSHAPHLLQSKYMCVSCAPYSCVRAGVPRNSLRCGHRLRHHHLHASAVLIMAIVQLSSSLQGLSLSNSRTCQRAQPHLGWCAFERNPPSDEIWRLFGRRKH